MFLWKFWAAEIGEKIRTRPMRKILDIYPLGVYTNNTPKGYKQKGWFMKIWKK